MTEKTTLDVTVEALAHLICGEADWSGGPTDLPLQNRKWHTIGGQFFDGFEVVGLREFNDADPSSYVLLGKDAADQPVWPLDVCVAIAEPGEGWPPGTWQFSRVRTLRPADWRGRLHKFLPRMVEYNALTSQPDGKHVSLKVPFGLAAGRAVQVPYRLAGYRDPGGMREAIMDPGYYGGEMRDTEMVDYANAVLPICAGLALRRRYLWSVMLGEGDGPRARFMTDPIGVRESFRLRDIPPGKMRRAALLHWVREHWRKRREPTANDRSWVRQHLRGAWSYSWNGLRCTIEPAPADLEMLADG